MLSWLWGGEKKLQFLGTSVLQNHLLFLWRSNGCSWFLSMKESLPTSSISKARLRWGLRSPKNALVMACLKAGWPEMYYFLQSRHQAGGFTKCQLRKELISHNSFISCFGFKTDNSLQSQPSWLHFFSEFRLCRVLQSVTFIECQREEGWCQVFLWLAHFVSMASSFSLKTIFLPFSRTDGLVPLYLYRERTHNSIHARNRCCLP